MTSILQRASMRDALRLCEVTEEPNRLGFIRCVFHHPDNTPSLHLVGEKGRESGYRCFACEAHGGVLDFVVAMGYAPNRGGAAQMLEDQIVGVTLQPSVAAKSERIADHGSVQRALEITPLSTVSPERVEWLWRSRIPRGKLTLLVGDPGAGKSFASLAITAAVTRGRPLPDGQAVTPANVLIWNGEDGLGDTIRPRAESCGVDLDRCFIIKGQCDTDGTPSPFGLGCMDILGETIAQVGAALVIIDPLAALLSGVDSHKDADIRAALQPLVDFAATTGAAILAIMHLRKAEAERALYRVGGSIGFTGLARSVLLCATDPEDGRRAIAPLKSNLSAAPTPVEYRIDAEGNFWWGQMSGELTAEHLLRTIKHDRGGAVADAEKFLRDVLSNGPRPAREVEVLRQEAMLSDRTLDRARTKLGVISRRSAGQNGHPKGVWLLSLPDEKMKERQPGAETN